MRTWRVPVDPASAWRVNRFFAGWLLFFALNFALYRWAWEQPRNLLVLTGALPAFAARTPWGEAVTVDPARKRLTVINFFSTADGYSPAELDNLWKPFIAAHPEMDFVWVARVQAREQAMPAFQANLPPQVQLVFADESVWETYRVTHGAPMTYFVDPTGRMRLWRVGGGFTPAQLADYYARLLFLAFPASPTPEP